MDLHDIPLHQQKTPKQQAPKLAITPFNAETLDLESELFAKYTSANQLYNDVEFDETVPTNQKAQVLNTIMSILTSIKKMQEEVQNTKRLKSMETALISTLRTLPAEAQALFFKTYEAELARIN